MAMNSKNREEKLAQAYNWAVEQMGANLSDLPKIRFVVDDGDILTYNSNTINISFFRDMKNENTIMRQQDIDRNVSYEVVLNYYEMTRVAPRLLEKLLDNGIALYEEARRRNKS